ncbi:MAG: peptidase [Proteobacteria bacterium]|nr:peptidase [Pseudomonadota bacterium]
MHILKALALTAVMFFAFSCKGEKEPESKNVEAVTTLKKAVSKKDEAKPMVDGIDAKLAKLVRTEIGVDEVKIPNELRPVLKKLVMAAKLMDKLFLRQVSKENPTWREQIANDPKQKNTLAYFDVMYGPWDRFDHNKPFWGNREKPKAVTFYPQDLTVEEFNKWIEKHPDQKEAFRSYFTVIERDGNGLKAVPYSEAYREILEPAAKLLNEAAELARDKRLKKYLKSRAKAFLDNKYRQSDMDWIDLGDGDIEVVIGPYEVYEDELMGYKATFESFVTLRDPEDSKKLAEIKALIPEMEAYLPIPDEHKNLDRSTESPISVVDVLFTAGDTRAGAQTLAFNLPNDEVVRDKKGSKKVMLKNVSRAKYDKILIPIAKRIMREDQVKNISFDAFFNHNLVHETAHGLGPGKIKFKKDGKLVETTVNAELKDLYTIIEEAKADVLGMYLNYMLIEKGLHPVSFMEETYASFLGGFFRSIRFGANEAHGQANIIQFNYFLEKGALFVDKGKYAYAADKMRQAIKSLARDLLMIEAEGNYEAAKALIEKHGTMNEALNEALAGLDVIPTDLRPIYPIEKQVEKW